VVILHNVVLRSVAEPLDSLAVPPLMDIGSDSRSAVRLLSILRGGLPGYRLRAWLRGSVSTV